MLVIVFLPLILLLLLILRIRTSKEKKKESEKKKEARNRYEEIMRENLEKNFTVPYTEPAYPLPDGEFISRIGEFECVQYHSWNGLSAMHCNCELVASRDPEKKEKILSFLEEHPISELLYGETFDKEICDADHWELRFIFPDPALNRRIKGYGRTEDARPFLWEMVRHIPELLSLREQEENEFWKWKIEQDIKRIEEENKSSEV